VSDRTFDIAIVGGGIVGLATALQLLRRRPGLRLAVLEREAQLGGHQSTHNSGVVHAGLYYTPGSLKARLCREGKADLERFCEEHDIPLRRVGKLVVATDPEELPRLAALKERATANGVEGLEEVGPERIREIEPHAAGIAGLYSPGTGIVDYGRVVAAYAAQVAAGGGTILTSHRMTALRADGPAQVLETTGGTVRATSVITCAGLWADQVAAMTGGGGTERIIPFRGDFYTFRPAARALVNGLIYPVPDPRFPFLGVHLTRRIDGGVLAGPNAVLAFARTGYRRTDINPADLAGYLAFPGFLRLARKFWRTGLAEMWRDVSKAAFLASCRRYVPELQGRDLVFGPSGVRAQALDRDGTLVDDFRLGGTGAILHVRNAPSPAATASLAIGRELAETAIGRFGLA
jgi:L-2-hydroxyglutarate oxidase